VLPFYLDEHVSERLTDTLHTLGVDATSAGRTGNKGLNDALQLLVASRLGRTLVTYDVEDFTLLHEAWHSWSRAWNATAVARHAGILMIYSSRGVSLMELANELHRFAGTEVAIDNRLFAWNRKVGWHEVV
jgi:hypothetical protein